MKKTIAAVVAGTLLAATQALAAGEAAPRVADRIGAPAGASDELMGGASAGLIFAAITIGAFALVVSSDDDDSESD